MSVGCLRGERHQFAVATQSDQIPTIEICVHSVKHSARMGASIDIVAQGDQAIIRLKVDKRF